MSRTRQPRNPATSALRRYSAPRIAELVINWGSYNEKTYPLCPREISVPHGETPEIGEQIMVERNYDADLGVGFQHYTFDVTKITPKDASQASEQDKPEGIERIVMEVTLKNVYGFEDDEDG